MQAFTEAERSAALDAEDFEAELVALCITSRGARVFTSAEQVAWLEADEARALVAAMSDALHIVAPQPGDADAKIALERGAAHTSNLPLALLMAETRMPVAGFTEPVFHDRPDLYFGRPVADLTMGQMMAYRAACQAIERLKPKS